MNTHEHDIIQNIGKDLKTILPFSNIEDYKTVIKNYLNDKNFKCRNITVVKTKPTNDRKAITKIIINIYLTIIRNWNIEIVLASK